MIGEVISNAKMEDFGDLVVCVQQMADNYKFLCPPYTILLVRTFATLEGLAAKCDAEFNMYEACLPYAIRRALAPTTAEGKKELRETLINSKGEFAFENFQESLDLMQRMEEQLEADGAAARAEDGGVGEATGGAGEHTNITNAITGRAPEIVGSLATAPEGSTIRKIMKEADTVALVGHVLSQVDGRQSKAVTALASSMQEGRSLAHWESRSSSQKPASARQGALGVVMKHYASLWSAGPKGILMLAKIGLTPAGGFVLDQGRRPTAMVLAHVTLDGWRGRAWRPPTGSLEGPREVSSRHLK